MSAELRIVHTADAHGTEAVYQALEGRIDLAQDLFLDAGDAISGSNTAFRWKEPNLHRLSRLGCSAMTMGNRELHYLPWVLEQRAQERNFPLLAANLVDLWGRATTWQDGITVERGGLRIGVFGMTVVQYPVGALYERIFGLRFLPPETLIESLVSHYQKDHDVVVFLSHLGVARDRELAKQLAAKPKLKLDLLLGGHSHTLFRQPEQIGGCQLSHIGSHSRGYGEWLYEKRQWRFAFHGTSEAML